MKLLVTGVTRTGNLGGTAMLCATEDVLGDVFDDVALCSILPDQDTAQRGPDRARIVPADYRFWLIVVAPLCIAFWPLRRLTFVRRMLARIELLGEFASADAVADLSGIAFVDGRGLALLYYNAAVVLPGLFFSVPVYKLSQAVGPFRHPLNRALARWVLTRCQGVAARGQQSLEHLRRLGIDSAVLHSDTSFALQISAATRDAAVAQVRAACGDDGGHLVICSPSAVVAKRCFEAGIDMAAALTETFTQLRGRGVRVALLAHSTDTGIRKNDDHEIARRITDALKARGIDAPLLDPAGDPSLARAMIGQADVFVATRFHSLISALSQAVPTATIGWSHKYAEAAEPFGMGEFTIDYGMLTAQDLVSIVDRLLTGADRYRERMRSVAKTSRMDAIAGIKIVAGRRA